MSLAGLLSVIAEDPGLRHALSLGDTDADLVAPPALRPLLAAALATTPPGADQPGPGPHRFVLAVTATAREAEDLTSALESLLPPGTAACFPAWETLPHERISPRSDTSGRRLAVLRRLAHPDPGSAQAGPVSVLVTPVRSLLQPMVSGLGDLEPVTLRPGQDADFEQTITRLVDIGYVRADLVEHRGEIAVRGGILDVFPPTEEHPLRVEFWGDSVEEIRYFRVADQRSLHAADSLWAPPCRELLLTPAVRERARQLAKDHPGLAEILGKLADGIGVEGMEAFAPVLADRMELLLDHVPPGGLVLACDPERIRARAADLVRTSQEFLEASWVNAAAGGQAPVDLGAAAFQPLAAVRTAARDLGVGWWTITPFDSPDALPGELPDVAEAGAERLAFNMEAAPVPGYRGDTARAVADVRQWLADGWRVALVTEGHGPAQRLAEMLRGEGLGARLGDLDQPPEPAVPYVSTGLLQHGFIWAPVRLAVLTEADLAGQRTASKELRMPARRRGGIDPLQLTPGDYIVHEQHGVGRYLEMTSRSVQGATREYLVIEYAASKRGQPPDRLYVPTDQLDQVTRYVGGEAPSLHRLGGADWAKTKGRARKAVRQIAAELIRLYSARMASPGHAFGADTPWQRELEDAFPYVETPDQLGAINEVKRDMERPVPMDRLICGDVGYGKTEIAVRAAFKAVQDGSQVAVLVPTTLLAQQHFNTFSERFAPFPVTVRMLSRFSSDAEAAQVREEMTEGKVDVVVGTHRLLSPDTRFARLGLVILDEEQRFGVEHKEYLKRLRTEVDVLAMSATPIPRTLEMGIAGIREMSTILTPPEERHPVLTLVGPYDEKQIAAAIRRELLRDGQVFFVHNRVSSINRVAARLARAGPGGPDRGRPRADERARAGRRDERLPGPHVRRAGVHHDHRVRAGHPEREHADRGPRGHLRAAPAAPAARPGRPEQRARLRLLPVPAGDPADRDRARAAGHHRAAHRGGRGHVRGAEGPGDPRRGQPARRRAVRAHRRGRLRPVRADDRRGGHRAEGRRSGRAARRSGWSCRSTRTSRTTTCPASGSGWRPTPGSRPSIRPRTSPRSGMSWPTGTGRCPSRWRTCWRWRGCGSRPAGPGWPTSSSRARSSGSPRSSCPTPGRSGCSGCTRRRCSSPRCVACSYRCPGRHLPGAPHHPALRCSGTLSCWPGAPSSSRRCWNRMLRCLLQRRPARGEGTPSCSARPSP